ncbi:metal-dependent protein hydrolase [Crassisporium funariophilum]|nr:metal-dependent protein hydrolase [Crassisporium funariophilum]
MFANLLRSATSSLSRLNPHSILQVSLSFPHKCMSVSESPQAKRQKMEKTIGTHNGTFHCDEALAVFLLRHTALYRNAGTPLNNLSMVHIHPFTLGLKRSRDPVVLDTCDIVVDVGAVYDEPKQRFDHHQRGFTEVFGHGFETKLSSAGLIYKHFGQEIIAETVQSKLDDPKVNTLWLKMYKEFIEAIDAIDNGISQYPNDIKPKYRSRTDLSSRVGALNPAWNQPTDSETVDAQFGKASSLTGEEFMGKLNYYANAWLPARDLLIASVASSKASVDHDGQIILFEQFLPWKEHLFELEADEKIPGIKPNQAIYVVYPDETANNWRIQAVPLSPESFESRKALPEAWRGLRDEELSKASGIEGGIFIHASGFIGGNKTKEGALKIAQAALAM